MASAYQSFYDDKVTLATEQYESTVHLSPGEALELAGQLARAATAILGAAGEQ